MTTYTGGKAPAQATERRGSVGLLQGSALYIAAVLGTGILVLPALAAQIAGPASILSVAAVLLLSIPLAGTFAALAARYPDAGGVATFVRLALGATAARMAGYWFFFGVAVGVPVVATLGAQYLLAALAPAGGVQTWHIVIVALALMVPPLIANLMGVRVSGSVQLVLTGLLLLLVVAVVIIALPAAAASRFTPFMPHGWAGVGAAVSLFVWAFAGWEAVTHIAGEFREPRRIIPRATAIAIAVVGLAYLALQFITVAVLDTGGAQSAVPLLDLIAATAPGFGPVFVAVIAAIVVMGVLNAYLLAFANLGASLARDGDLPAWLARGAGRGEIPRRALVVVTAIGVAYFVVLALRQFDLTPFILIHTSSMVAVYALGMVAAVRLLARYTLGWWMAVLSVVLVGGLLALAGANLVVPAILAAAALLVTLIQRRSRARIPTR